MQLTSIHVYPIKSCRGVAVGETRLVARGLELDRRYMVVDDAGMFVTQRKLARMALVDTRFSNGRLHVSAPSAGSLDLPLTCEDGPRKRVTVWSSEVEAIEATEGSQWFSHALGQSLHLVYMPETTRRAVNPERAKPSDIVSFADGYPLLLIGEASLHDLNARLPRAIEMARFRPNLVFAGGAPYQEDAMSRLRIGELTFRGVKRCDRCVVTTLDTATAEGGVEPLRTLSGYRKEDGKVWFGMNLVHDGEGFLRVGDRVAPLSA